jgi:hypothetical protein
MRLGGNQNLTPQVTLLQSLLVRGCLPSSGIFLVEIENGTTPALPPLPMLCISLASASDGGQHYVYVNLK